MIAFIFIPRSLQKKPGSAVYFQYYVHWLIMILRKYS